MRRFFANTRRVIAATGISTLATMLLVASAIATNNTSVTDTINVTVESNCELSYAQTAHTNGASHGTWGSGDTKNTLSATMTNASVDTNIGSTNFSVVCNDGGGSQVAVTATALTSENSDTIAFSADAPASTTSSWGISNGTSWIDTGDYAWSTEESTSTTSFSVTYGVGVDATQSAGTYTGTATYTLTHPYVAPTTPEMTFDQAFAAASKTKFGNYYKMQDMTSSICDAVSTPDTTTEAPSTQLIDARDSKVYWVSKLLDGECWMTQNLDLNITTAGLNSETSDLGYSDGSYPSTTKYWNSSSTYPPTATVTAASSSITYTGTLSWDLGNYYWTPTSNTSWSSCGTSATSYADCTSYGFSTTKPTTDGAGNTIE